MLKIKNPLFRLLNLTYLPVTLTLAFTVVLGLASLIAINASIDEQNRSKLRSGAQDIMTLLDRTIEADLEVVHSVQSIFAVSESVTREEFRQAVTPSLARHPEILALEWTVRVQDNDREHVEGAVRQLGFPEFKFSEFNKDGKRVRALRRSEYVVIVYAEPMKGNEAALGLDISTLSVPRETLAQALRTGLGVSPWLTLAQGETGFVVYAPIKPKPGERQSFAAGVFRLARLFEVALQGMPRSGVSFIVSESASDAGGQLFKYDAPTRLLMPATPANIRQARDTGLTWETRLRAGNQSWSILFFPSADFRSAYPAGMPYLFAAGLLVTGILIALFTSSLRQAHVVTGVNVKLEEALRIRDEFLAVASHELKTPMTPLKIQLYLLRKQLQESASSAPGRENVVRYIDNADRQLSRLAKLIENLLDVTRISAGKLRLTLEEFDLSLLAREIAERYEAELVQAGCTLRLEAGAPVSGWWDRLRIEQVIVNLLTNAAKFGAGKPIDLRIEKSDEKAVLTLQDYGVGITAENQKKVFERFERGDPSNHFAGLGLGLYITRQIVEAHQGTIAVQSEPGKGTTFTVELPVAVGAHLAQQNP